MLCILYIKNLIIFIYVILFNLNESQVPGGGGLRDLSIVSMRDFNSYALTRLN